MGTAENPDVFIQYWTGTAWQDILANAADFNVQDAGLLQIPMATVNFLNPSNVPDKFDQLRILADVRGVDDLIFYGNVETIEKKPVVGTVNKKKYRLTCYGLEKRFKKDTITWEYEAEQAARDPETKWTFKTMIEDFLANPDTGYDTGFILDTDTEAEGILAKVYGDCNFNRQTLQDAFRTIAEIIGYDGYAYIVTEDGTADSGSTTTTVDAERIEANDYWNGGFIHYKTGPNAGLMRLITDFHAETDMIIHEAFPNPVASGHVYEVNLKKIKFVKLGTLAASPATTISDPFIGKPVLTEDIDEIKNYVLVWGHVEIGYPVDEDKFTERGYAKYDPVIWEGLNGETITDHQYSAGEAPTEGVTRDSDYCIESNRNSNYSIILRLHINNTGVSYIDLNRYGSINFLVKVLGNAGYYVDWRIRLIDTASKEVRWKNGGDPLHTTLWKHIFLALPISADDIEETDEWLTNTWCGDTDINLTQIEKADIWINLGYAYLQVTGLWVDWFLFGGAYKIDPFQHPALNPPVKDDTSISNYGVRLYHHDNQEIRSFDQAQKEGERVLAVLKNPIKTVVCTKLGHTWLRPHQTVTLNSSTLGISSETWRLGEINWDWRSNEPIYATMRLVPQYAQTPPVFAPEGTVPTTGLLPVMPSPLGKPSGLKFIR